MKNILYLGSQSQSRQKLLTDAHIPFTILQHDSTEDIADQSLPFHDYVLAIAQHKMEHLLLPDISQIENPEKEIIVLTADTLMRMHESKQILGKPKDIDDAKHMLRLMAQDKIELITGCCLDQIKYTGAGWITLKQSHWTTPATLEFCIPEDEIDEYLEKTPLALKACGAAIVEQMGINYLKSVIGSYSTIIGLPLFELRYELKKMGFF